MVLVLAMPGYFLLPCTCVLLRTLSRPSGSILSFVMFDRLMEAYFELLRILHLPSFKIGYPNGSDLFLFEYLCMEMNGMYIFQFDV